MSAQRRSRLRHLPAHRAAGPPLDESGIKHIEDAVLGEQMQHSRMCVKRERRAFTQCEQPRDMVHVGVRQHHGRDRTRTFGPLRPRLQLAPLIDLLAQIGRSVENAASAGDRRSGKRRLRPRHEPTIAAPHPARRLVIAVPLRKSRRPRQNPIQNTKCHPGRKMGRTPRTATAPSRAL